MTDAIEHSFSYLIISVPYIFFDNKIDFFELKKEVLLILGLMVYYYDIELIDNKEYCMKFDNHHEPEDKVEEKREQRWTQRVKQYLQNLYNSAKWKRMSHGSYDILRSMSWARNENWRRNHPKSLNKQHKKDTK